MSLNKVVITRENIDLLYNLPRTTEHLVANELDLEYLPENLPPNLQILEARCNKLKKVFLKITSKLPMSLAVLDVSWNELVSLPPLYHTELHSLLVHCNNLRFIPGLPPTIKFVNCSGNPLLECLPKYLHDLKHLVILKTPKLKELPFLPSDLELVMDNDAETQLVKTYNIQSGLTMREIIENINELNEFLQNGTFHGPPWGY